VETELDLATVSSEDVDAALAESTQMEAIISELQMMSRQAYGQYCGLARALEMIGERWALLVIRDLLVGPKRFTELLRGLPRVPADILSTRLAELENTGVVRRRVLARDDDSFVYELTEYGHELDDIVLSLGRWGAASLGSPRAAEIVTPDSLVMAMRSAFRPAAARGHRVSYELRLGDIVIHACVDDGVVKVAAGALPDADLVIEPGRELKAMMTGETTPAEAMENGVRVIGDPSLLGRFVELFHVPGPAARHERP
jgi:DNA-binding HxlR family transcriptional regulator